MDTSSRFLAGRTAVVTGASRGIGRAISVALAGAGARIALLGRNREKLDESLALVREAGSEGQVFLCDVRDEAQVQAAAAGAAKAFGPLHILVNNAGTAIRKDVIEFSLDEWRTLMDTNVTGTFLMCKYVVPHMKGQGYGRIINLTSIMAHVSTPGRGVYSATKHAVAGLTKALAQELAAEGINCTAISPGFIATDLTAPLRANAERSAELMALTPLGRWGQADEIASLALYMCSPKASFMTGNDVLMDGGWCSL